MTTTRRFDGECWDDQEVFEANLVGFFELSWGCLDIGVWAIHNMSIYTQRIIVACSEDCLSSCWSRTFPTCRSMDVLECKISYPFCISAPL